ncbi:MAG: tRNA lysidine(34) synthetase TilS, partial [Ktedonobacteraceae bacterium]
HMLEKVITFIERHQLLPAQGTIVVAVSGGADSLCLLHLLLQLCGPGKRYPTVELHAAHLNHLLRGTEGAHDAQAVASMLANYAVPFTLGEIDVVALAQAEKRSLEDAARVARYRFLREVAQGRLIAVAHHADDQVETLLLHWLRGSGLSGLVGMLPRQQDIIRPLLEITHAETVTYCQKYQMTPLEDLSNDDPRFLRNRLRHEVLPLLQELNPGLQRTLLRNAEVVRVDLAWLETQVDSHWASIVVAEQEHAIKLDVPTLLTLPLSLQRHLLRRVTAHLCTGQSPLESRHLLLIEQLLNKQQGSELHLPQHLRARTQNHALIVERSNSIPQPVASQSGENTAILPIPGTTQVPGTTWQARAEVVPIQLVVKMRQDLQQANRGRLASTAQYHVSLDGQSLGTHLLVRTKRPGDRIQPLGMLAEKKVQDIFVDQHVPRATRATIPLFFSDKHCLWVAGSCLDHRVRLTDATQQIVHLSIQPIEPEPSDMV